MAKLAVYYKTSVLFIALLFASFSAATQYSLVYSGTDRSVAFLKDTLGLQDRFATIQSAMNYVQEIPAMLEKKGYPAASVDSVFFDSTRAYCLVYTGEAVKHVLLNTDSVEQHVLENIGWTRLRGKSADPVNFRLLQEKTLSYMENNGYPFAKVSIENVMFSGDTLSAEMKVDKGPLYTIDSIRNFGSGSISSGYLQQYLGIRNGSIYRKDKLAVISDRIRELPFLQEGRPWDMTLLGTGSILNLYLDTRKSSEVNVLVGLLPSNDQLLNNKMLVTGEANINLRNALGGGETIGLNWQQIQVKSPRLNILYQQPYLFGTAFGLNFNFDLLKKDSSYVNINMLVGASYSVSARQTGTVFLQRFNTNLLTVDTMQVKSTRRLPQEADVSSVNLGINYELFTTDYRFNPRKGQEFFISASAGTRNIRKNNVIVQLYDESDPAFNYGSLYDTFQMRSYQFRIRMKAAHYFPLGRVSAIRAAFNGGWFQSPAVFRNELFQIGGYKLLRGFDEESIFASAYGVMTAEYRYLLGQNSFLSAFADYGVTGNRLRKENNKNNFLGIGLGMAFETKAGVFNIAYAVGKRDDQNFNLRQSKIHLGYVNYF